MYSWIWRKLPFGLPGKLVGSVLLIVGIAATLWFWAFPNLAPLLPFGQINISESDIDGEDPQEDPGRAPSHDTEDFELEESPSPDEGP